MKDKKKIQFKQKIKNYFTEKPKQNFWFHAFIILFIFRYVSPLTIMFLMFFQIGLVAPGVDMSGAINTASENITLAFMKPMEILYNAGATIGLEHPIIAKVLFFVLSNLIYVIYVAMIILIINILRYVTSWIIRKKKTHKSRQPTTNINKGN